MTDLKCGCIGLGRMGSGFATHLLKGGFATAVHDIRPEAVQRLADAGATACDSPADVARFADVTLLSLINHEQVEAVLFDRGFAEAAANAGKLVIDTTTMSPENSIRIADRLVAFGIALLDAPVTGGEGGAQSGNTIFMVGGEEAQFRRALPMFQAMGSHTVHIGDQGAGSVAKMVNQLAMVASMAGIAESFAYAERKGVAIDRIVECINPGGARDRWMGALSRHYAEKRDLPRTRDDIELDHYSRLFIKDLGCLLESGWDLPVTQALRDNLQKAWDARAAGDFPFTLIQASRLRLDGE